MIMPDGRVLGCGCMDGKQEMYCGHIEQSTIQEIWCGDGFMSLRNSFRIGNLYTLCKTCSYYSDYEEVCSRPGLKNFNPLKNFWKCV